MDFYLGRQWNVDAWSIDLGALRYQYPGTNAKGNNTDEYHVGVGYDFRAASTSVTFHYSPDFFGAGRALYWAFGIALPLPRGFAVAGHYGVTDYEDDRRGDDYRDGSVGIATERGGFGFDLKYTGTSGLAGGCVRDTCDNRFVFTVSRSL